MKKKALLAWSSGKDSALALYRMKQDPSIEVVGLFTTLREIDRKIPIHEVGIEFVENQARAIGIPLISIPLPPQCPNSIYEERIQKGLEPSRAQGVTLLVFGDLYLREIREYREKQFKASGFQLHFPLWGRSTSSIAEEILRVGIRAVVTAVDTTKLDSSFVGREFTASLVKEFPKNVDPCGENGEFHTFVFFSPNFNAPIQKPL